MSGISWHRHCSRLAYLAGVVLTYMRPSVIRDHGKLADTTGDVMEETLLLTCVRTTKDVDITIPTRCAMVLGSRLVDSAYRYRIEA
ncbi:MAG: hypothetical protein JNN16_11155 [Nitrospira sp.]|nr:hypothetical protein [Nitrospira sp.]